MVSAFRLFKQNACMERVKSESDLKDINHNSEKAEIFWKEKITNEVLEFPIPDVNLYEQLIKSRCLPYNVFDLKKKSNWCTLYIA